jgi:predicted nucleotidyltransferase
MGRDFEELELRIRQVAEAREDVLECYLFGSQARGVASARSDIDVAFMLESGAGAPAAYGADADLGAALMQALGTDKVDVVLLNQATPLLYYRVLRDGVRIFSRNLAATTGREARALSRYFDFAPQIVRVDRLLAERIGNGDFGR